MRLPPGPVAPSKLFMTLAADEIAQREQFVLLDEQSAVTKDTQ